MKSVLTILQWLWFLPRRCCAALIEGYQQTLSPDTGWLRIFFPYGYCKFTPTCSEYGKQVIQKKGVLVGGLLAVWRILRCNPWSKGGEDRP